LNKRKNANAAYKYAVRFIDKHEQAMRAESMAEKVMDNHTTEFWKEVKGLNKCRWYLRC